MFAIAPYLVEVKDGNKQPQDLWNFFHKNNLHNVLNSYYKDNLNKYQPSINNPKRMFMVSKIFAGSTQSVSGIYQTGQFGYESDIYSTGKKKITHKRMKDEADMVPFYFSFYFNKDPNAAQRERGLLLLGRFNTLGVRGITIPHLQQHFSQRFNNFSLSIERVVPKVVMETLLKNGSLKNIRLIKKRIPKDIADVLSMRDRDQVQEIELIIRSKRKSRFDDVNWALNAISNNSQPSQILTIPSFAHDNVKLDIVLEGRKRTLNIGRPGAISSNMELDLQPGPDGHPIPKEWLAEADEIAANIMSSWGIKGQSWKSSL